MCVSTFSLQKDQETLHPIPNPLEIWSQMGIGLPGPLKERNSYKYKVTAVDYTCKFVEAEPLKEKTGSAVAEFLYTLLCQYQIVYIHITDQGGELVNSISKEVYHLICASHSITSYHTQANGLAECQIEVQKTASENMQMKVRTGLSCYMV